MEERRFGRSFRSLSDLFAFMDDFAGRHGIPADAAFDLKLALEELFTNMVKSTATSLPAVLHALVRLRAGLLAERGALQRLDGIPQTAGMNLLGPA